MQKQTKNYIVFIILISVLIAPSIALASWWNPFSWNWNIFDIFNIFSKPQATVVQPNQNTNQTPTDQTADWRAYANGDYGFSFKYPANFNLSSQSSNYIEIKSSDPHNLFFAYVQVQDNKKNLTAQDYANNLGIAGPTTPNKNKVIKKISVDGVEAWEVTIDNLPSDADPSDPNYVVNHTLNASTIYLVKNGNLYIFEVYNKSGLDKNYNVADFNLLLSTFKFTNPVSTSTTQPSITVISPNRGEAWQIGTNQKVKYSISSNMPVAGTCVDAYAVNSAGNKTPLILGAGLTRMTLQPSIPFQLGIDNSANIQPGQYKVELDVHYCAETNNAFITSTTSANYFNITAASPDTPSITVHLPPESACVWGRPCVISWTSNKVDKITIQLDTHLVPSIGMNSENIVIQIPASLGSYSWIVPSDGSIPAGNGMYKITIAGSTTVGTYVMGSSGNLSIWQQAQ